MDAMGPLRKLWEKVEAANKERGLHLFLSMIFIRFLTQSIILLEQTDIALLYHRRLSALDGVKKCFEKYHTNKIHVEKQM